MNTFLPSYDKMMYMKKIGGNEWILLAPELSVLHDNGIGDSELKYIHPDGREVVYTRDFSSDGSYEIYTDPKYKGTYNYVVLGNKPDDILDVKGWIEFGVMGIGQYLNFIHSEMKEITAMRKKINNYICFLVLFLCSLPIFGYEIPLYDVAYDKDIIVSLPYIKAEGVTATPIHSRLSVKIDKLIINGKKRIRGKRIWWWMGADETYALLNHQVANTKESIENIDMSWNTEKTDKGYKLVYSSLIHSVPTIYEIPDTAKEVSMTYRVKFPDGSFSPENTIHFNLSWPKSP